MRLPRLITGGAIVAVLAGAAACGLQTLEPKLELRQAASDFAAERTGGLRLSLASSAAQFRAFAAEGDREGGTPGSTTISDADLNRLLTSSIAIAYDGGTTKDTADDAARVDVRIGALDAGEIRVADQVLYARVDLPGLERQFPDMKDGLDSAHASLTGQDGSMPPAPALQVPVDALFAGKWVSLDVGPDSWLQKQFQAASGGSDAGASSGSSSGTGIESLTGGLSTDAPAKLKAIAGKAFANGVSVTRLDSEEKLGDHLVATANLRTVYKNVRGDLAGLFSGSPAETIGQALPQPGDVPDRQLSVSFWVKDGTLTRVELDLAQFLSKPSGALVLRADNLPSEKITAPSGAVPVHPQVIAQQTGISPDELLGGAGAGSATDAHAIAGYVDEDISGMAADDGAAPSLAYLQQAIQDMDGIADGLVIAPVGDRVQVTLNGSSACLVLPPTADGTGTVTDGPCS